jgi:hypothetical protein
MRAEQALISCTVAAVRIQVLEHTAYPALGSVATTVLVIVGWLDACNTSPSAMPTIQYWIVVGSVASGEVAAARAYRCDCSL